MCSFFSFISDGKGQIKYFDYEQRKEGAKMPDTGEPPESYDSHTSIATYYGITGAKEDEWNKWEYNPITEKLTLDKLNTTNDRTQVLEALKAVDFQALCGDVERIRELIRCMLDVHWFANDGQLPEGVKLFDTRAAAWAAARDAAWAAARDAAGAAARAAARAAAGDAARAAAWDAAWDAARAAAGDAAWDAA